MKKDSWEEKRWYERYDTALKIYFDFAYDIKTKVKFQLIDRKKAKTLSPKYSALSKNVSAEGLCFASRKKLRKGDYLNLEVYLPSAVTPVRMQGEVRWSTAAAATDPGAYQTGVLLKTVNDESVPATIHYDKEYRLHWSVVLESVLGSFKNLIKGKDNPLSPSI